MTVFDTADGQYVVRVSKKGRDIAGPFKTMAEAWKWIDRHNNEAISSADRRSEWIWSKMVGGL